MSFYIRLSSEIHCPLNVLNRLYNFSLLGSGRQMTCSNADYHLTFVGKVLAYPSSYFTVILPHVFPLPVSSLCSGQGHWHASMHRYECEETGSPEETHGGAYFQTQRLTQFSFKNCFEKMYACIFLSALL